ncbi:hypothetical protein V8E36_006676 [Tilletia maclaganii]
MRCSSRSSSSLLTIAFSVFVLLLAVIYLPSSGVSAQNLAQQPAPNSGAAQPLTTYPSSWSTNDSHDDGGVNPLAKGKIPREKDFVGKCFRSEKDLMDATKDCSGRGAGRQSRAGGAVCWRCVCKADRREGRVTYFAGEACQKIDLSGPFVLLATTTIILILIVGGAVGLLFRQGQEEVPSTLAGVSVVSKDK